ncbi:dTDP-4-amino-4,6-dideoxygalactose transaminase [Aeromonas hydrophila]|uniref:dTDP-4-amino-4,6-dideoxygalactose transaminase n=1 Tax=Aeromonas hydrophila TaxID=644 RepID=UPI0029DDFD9C|nr:dTDP-4-amino-4,6-dideoxygalactose transaminase [Aeromonas hydrophila]MDX7778614.1 dTDP-4-amino-4,6-dideoxygalactose transaminase [Aeromonas hydrophila]
MHIPFNKPYMTGKELHYISQSHLNGQLAGDGPFTKHCHYWLEKNTQADRVLLTNSCTAALEMAALLLDIQPGDEIIVPSYTFVSTANAFVLRGAKPVFVDIREDTLNLNEKLIEQAITPKTKAIVPVHYAGVACEMDDIMDIARKYELMVVEDAAQGVMAKYKGNSLGSIGHLGAYSFHETKNVISGEGGALLVNQAELVQRAEIIREKGTDRSRFFRGEVDKYTWQSAGSSFLPGELIAAFLWAQLEEAKNITEKRLAAWNYYHELFAALEIEGLLRRPVVPAHCQHNAHMYYILLPEHQDRQVVLDGLKAQQINAVFHYVPLHSSPAGLQLGRVHGEMTMTDSMSARLIRLPLWLGISQAQQERVSVVLSNLLKTP